MSTAVVPCQLDSSEKVAGFRFRAFRAVDDPATSAKFVAGHHEALGCHGVAGLDSAKESWTTNPNVYVLIAEDPKDQSILAGIRIHVADGNHRLPVEDAVGHLDPKLTERVSAELDFGTGEICGLWRSSRGSHFQDLVHEMAVSVIALTHALGVRSVWGLAPGHTLEFWQSFGYEVDTTFGRSGGFEYPDARYFSQIVYLNTETFRNTPPSMRHQIFEFLSSNTSSYVCTTRSSPLSMIWLMC